MSTFDYDRASRKIDDRLGRLDERLEAIALLLAALYLRPKDEAAAETQYQRASAIALRLH